MARTFTRSYRQQARALARHRATRRFRSYVAWLVQESEY